MTSYHGAVFQHYGLKSPDKILQEGPLFLIEHHPPSVYHYVTSLCMHVVKSPRLSPSIASEMIQHRWGEPEQAAIKLLIFLCPASARD